MTTRHALNKKSRGRPAGAEWSSNTLSQLPWPDGGSLNYSATLRRKVSIPRSNSWERWFNSPAAVRPHWQFEPFHWLMAALTFLILEERLWVPDDASLPLLGGERSRAP